MVYGKVFAFFCSGSPGKVNFFDCSLVPDALQWIHVSPRLTKWRSNSFELCLSNVKNYCEVVSRLYFLLALLAIFRAPERVSLKTKMQPRRSSLNYFLTVAVEGDEAPYLYMSLRFRLQTQESNHELILDFFHFSKIHEHGRFKKKSEFDLADILTVIWPPSYMWEKSFIRLENTPYIIRLANSL